MDNISTIYERAEQSDKQTHRRDEEDVREKYNLVLKNKELCIGLRDTYIEVNDGVLSQVYGVLNLKALYIHNAIDLNIADCYAIAKYVNIYFIDARGNVVGEYVRSKIV